MERKIPIKNKLIQKLIDQKYEILDEGRENAKEAERLRQRNQELERQLEPIKQKLVDKMNKQEEKLDLGEFEMTDSTEKDEEGNYYITVVDKFEIFKKEFNKQKYGEPEQGPDQTNTSNEGLGGDREDNQG